jgi:hypothetical protein
MDFLQQETAKSIGLSESPQNHFCHNLWVNIRFCGFLDYFGYLVYFGKSYSFVLFNEPM